MTKAVIRSEEFSEGYRITNTARGLIIEPIGSDQKPLELTRAQLASYGLRYSPVGETKLPQGIVDKILATLDRAAQLMITQKPRSEWKGDVENLKRIFLIIGGLDEEGVQEILDEEK